MTKGKHAALQASKRLAAAEERIAFLEREIAEAMNAAHLEKQTLLTELQVLRNSFVSDVQAASAGQVEAIKREANDRIREIERSREESITKAFLYITQNGEVKLTVKGWADVSQILEMPMGRFLTASSPQKHSRASRRATRSLAHVIADAVVSPNPGPS